MKKIFLIVSVLGLISLPSAAEVVDFVSLLSYPVGSFDQVDVLQDATVYKLNLGNPQTQNGTITIADDFTMTGNFHVRSLNDRNHSVEFFVNNEMLVRGYQNSTVMSAGSIDMTTYGTNATVEVDRSNQEFMLGTTGTLSLPGRNEILVNALDIDGDIKFHNANFSNNEQILQRSATSGNAEWQTANVANTCSASMTAGGLSSKVGNCSYPLLYVKLCPTGYEMQSDGTCLQICNSGYRRGTDKKCYKVTETSGSQSGSVSPYSSHLPTELDYLLAYGYTAPSPGPCNETIRGKSTSEAAALCPFDACTSAVSGCKITRSHCGYGTTNNNPYSCEDFTVQQSMGYYSFSYYNGSGANGYCTASLYQVTTHTYTCVQQSN